MSDCTAIYPAKPIECLLGEGHDGDHAGDHVGHDIMERVVAQWPSDNAARLKGGE